MASGIASPTHPSRGPGARERGVWREEGKGAPPLTRGRLVLQCHPRTKVRPSEYPPPFSRSFVSSPFLPWTLSADLHSSHCLLSLPPSFSLLPTPRSSSL